MSDVNLEKYEVMPTEPLHDIKEHIKNILTEIPKHLNSEEKEHFQQIFNVQFGNKDKLRGSDYREGLIVIALYMRGKFSILSE